MRNPRLTEVDAYPRSHSNYVRKVEIDLLKRFFFTDLIIPMKEYVNPMICPQ